MNSDPSLRRRISHGLALLVSCVLVIATCGSDDDSPIDRSAPVTTAEPARPDRFVQRNQHYLNVVGCSEAANGELLVEDGLFDSDSQAALDLYEDQFSVNGVIPSIELVLEAGERDCDPSTTEG